MSTDQALDAELEALLNCLPPRLHGLVAQACRENGQLTQLDLDAGKKPKARFYAKDIDVVLEDRELSMDDMAEIMKRVEQNSTGFHEDNRAGINGTLHRISRIPNPRGNVPIGFSMRARHFYQGSANFIEDLVRAGHSILITGKANSGKTTLGADAVREASKFRHVVAIDTSSELGGDGDIPHSGLGEARRIQVKNRRDQPRFMREANQNLGAELVFIDEFSTPDEIRAAKSLKRRNIQVIATAHAGSIADLIEDEEYNELVGGITTVTMSDAVSVLAHPPKPKEQQVVKSPRPVFDVIVVLVDPENAIIYRDTAKAVQQVLDGFTPTGEKVKRTPGQILRTTRGVGSKVVADSRDLVGRTPQNQRESASPLEV